VLLVNRQRRGGSRTAWRVKEWLQREYLHSRPVSKKKISNTGESGPVQLCARMDMALHVRGAVLHFTVPDSLRAALEVDYPAEHCVYLSGHLLPTLARSDIVEQIPFWV
jgi:hypothetical protein